MLLNSESPNVELAAARQYLLHLGFEEHFEVQIKLHVLMIAHTIRNRYYYNST